MNRHPHSATIFVSIASYRDTELPLTVADLFSKATFPDRIHVGVLNQVDTVEDALCLAPDRPRLNQIVIHHTESQGACWARSRLFKELLSDETFILQIDSHMRFDPGWDVSMLNQWHQARDVRAVLSHYPVPYDTQTNVLHPQTFTQFNCQKFDMQGIPVITSAGISENEAPELPKPSLFIAGGCMFCLSSVVRDVPYDPHLYFIGEEFSYAVRLWTHGYNLYNPPRPFLYHDYAQNRGRHHHWTDHQHGRDAHGRAMDRLSILFNLKPVDNKEAAFELEKYGFGTVRTFAQWQEHHGIHLRLKLISHEARTGDIKRSIITA